MRKTFYIFIILFSVLLSSCRSWQPEGEEVLVVEGWIEEGAYPIVMVTTSVPTSTEYQSIDEQRSHLVRWGKVSVSDGEKTVVLTGMQDKRFFPPYIYTCTGSNTIRGELGKAYSIKVEYSGDVVTGTTTVPATVPLDSLWCEPSEKENGKYLIKARFSYPDNDDCFYRLLIKVEGKDSTYVPAYKGVVSEEFRGGQTVMSVQRGVSVENEVELFWNPALFEEGERVCVKFCSMDRKSYEFWSTYDRMVSLVSVPLFPATYNPDYSLEGGIGYWCGYGAKEYKITVK